MYLTEYVKEFGKYSFKERPFNNVDAVILATAIYSNFEVVCPTIDEPTKTPFFIKDISNFDLSVITAGKILVKGNDKLIPAMRDSNRFGNVGMRFLQKIFDEEKCIQFFAATFIVPSVGYFIAFRGTDPSVVGWQENFDLVSTGTMPSHKLAVEYINKVAEITNHGPIYIGGHSKGGNIALYSSIHCKKEAQDRLVLVYTLDGNGLKSKDFYQSEEYKRIINRIIFIRPYYSMVGEAQYNPKHFLVVESKNRNIFQHDSHSWKISKETGDFCYCATNSKNSLIIHWALKDWFKEVSVEDQKLVFNCIVKLFGGKKKTIFDFLLHGGKYAAYLAVKKSLTKEEKTRTKAAFKAYFAYIKKAKKRYKVDGKEKLYSTLHQD